VAEVFRELIQDLVKETTTSSGTANTSKVINLSGAADSRFQTFATAYGTSATNTVTGIPVTLTEGTTAQQTGLATFTHGTPSTIQFTSIDKGSPGITFTTAATVSIASTSRVLNGVEFNASSQTLTGTAPTVTLNTAHYLTIAGLTSTLNFTVPAGTAGDFLDIHIVDGDATEEIIIIGDTGVGVGGAGAATEWSRLFIKGERVRLRCIAANTWVIEYDGRIPCLCSISQSTEWTITSVSSWVNVKFTSGEQDHDVGGIVDFTINTSAGGAKVRRAGKYKISVSNRYSALADLILVGATYSLNNTIAAKIAHRILQPTSMAAAPSIFAAFLPNAQVTLSAGDEISAYAYQGESTSETCRSALVVKEIL
jgi:hypothetical protein